MKPSPWPGHGSRRSRVRFSAGMRAGRCCGIDHWVTELRPSWAAGDSGAEFIPSSIFCSGKSANVREISGNKCDHRLKRSFRIWLDLDRASYFRRSSKTRTNGYGSSYWGYQGTHQLRALCCLTHPFWGVGLTHTHRQDFRVTSSYFRLVYGDDSARYVKANCTDLKP